MKRGCAPRTTQSVKCRGAEGAGLEPEPTSRPARIARRRCHFGYFCRHMPQETSDDWARRAYATLNQALREPSGERLRAYLEEFWHPDAAFVNLPNAMEPGSHQGRDAVWLQIRRWVEAYPDFQIEPIELRPNGDRVFAWVRASGHGAASGIPIDLEAAEVITLEDGKVRRNEWYPDREEGLRAAGLLD